MSKSKNRGNREAKKPKKAKAPAAAAVPELKGLSASNGPAEKKKQGSTGISDERDELFDEAARLVVRHQQGSVSLIQRRLKVGYARAARIVDELEDAGIVGSFDGSKARAVLLESEAELEAYL